MKGRYEILSYINLFVLFKSLASSAFMIVYKYRSNYKRDISLLRRAKIFAPISEKLNDPFEGIVSSSIESELEELGIGSEILKNSVNGLLEKRNTVGIYSLSKTYKEELLWAHYADAHRGFCLELDSQYLLDLYYLNNENKNDANLIDIQYVKSSPIITLSDIKSKNKDTVFKKLIGTKSKSWSYEKETRVIFDKSGELNIDFRAIKSIYFGVRALDKNIQSVIDRLPFPISYYKMELDGNYKMSRVLIEKSKLRVKFKKPKTDALWINDSDLEYKEHSDNIRRAIEMVINEPYLESIVYAGVDRKISPGKVIIKITANRDIKFSTQRVKFYYFKMDGKRLIRFYD